METRHLAPRVKRLVAAARALEAAIAADDIELVQEAHAAVGRCRERLGPLIAQSAKVQADRLPKPELRAL